MTKYFSEENVLHYNLTHELIPRRFNKGVDYTIYCNDILVASGFTANLSEAKERIDKWKEDCVPCNFSQVRP